MDAARACTGSCDCEHSLSLVTNASEPCDIELNVKLIYSLKLVAGGSRSLDPYKLVPRAQGSSLGCTESRLSVCYGLSIV